MGPAGPPLDGDAGAGARSEGEDGRGRGGPAAPVAQLQGRRGRRRPHPRDAQDVWRDIAVFPFCKTCARRMVWRDIMGADASAADPNIAADEQGLV